MISRGMVSPPVGRIAAWTLDGQGGGTEWGEAAPVEGEEYWLHLDCSEPAVSDWLAEQADLQPIVVAALTAEETRPRTTALPGGLLVVLRGVNVTPGADPEDMVSIRLWLEAGRIVTTQRRHVPSAEDLQAELRAGDGPRGPADFLVRLAESLLDYATEVVLEVADAVDGLEEVVVAGEPRELGGELSAQRHRVARLRRFLAPMRDALARLAGERHPLLDEAERLRLRELAEHSTRLVEDLDLARERVGFAQEELLARSTERLSGRMYLLSLVAAIFLPLTFATGLLGINVGGIPGAGSPLGFAVVSGLLAAILVGQLWILHRLGWF